MGVGTSFVGSFVGPWGGLVPGGLCWVNAGTSSGGILRGGGLQLENGGTRYWGT